MESCVDLLKIVQIGMTKIALTKGAEAAKTKPLGLQCPMLASDQGDEEVRVVHTQGVAFKGPACENLAQC